MLVEVKLPPQAGNRAGRKRRSPRRQGPCLDSVWPVRVQGPSKGDNAIKAKLGALRNRQGSHSTGASPEGAPQPPPAW